MTTVQHLCPEDFQQLLEQTPNAVLLDVRNPKELADGIIPNSIHIHYSDEFFLSKVRQLDKDKTYFVFCGIGKRSDRTCQFMAKNGFQRIIHLSGSFSDWLAVRQHCKAAEKNLKKM